MTMSDVFHSPQGKALVHARYRAAIDSWPVPHRELRIATRQGETFVLAFGPEDAPPLILLHGGATTSIMWARSAPAWAESFRVYAVDIIGEPGLSAPSRPSLFSDAYARWLDDICSALRLTRASIVGASLGGLIALDYAIRHPERIARLALLAPAGITNVRPSYLLRVVPRFLMGARGRRKALELVMGLPREEMTSAAEEFLDFCELVMAHHAIRMQALPVFPDRLLKRLTMPVLAVLGAADVIFRSATVRRRLQGCLSELSVVWLPGVGHGLVDQTRTILQFLRGQTAHA
jgi:pimeloyl-ACP methyl ester carboxylesterase